MEGETLRTQQSDNRVVMFVKGEICKKGNLYCIEAWILVKVVNWKKNR